MTNPISYEFEFAVASVVRVIGLDCPGVVDAVMLTSGVPEFRVVYWWNGDRKVQWVYGSEIESRAK